MRPRLSGTAVRLVLVIGGSASIAIGQFRRHESPSTKPATAPTTVPAAPVPMLSFLRGLPVNARPNLKTGWDEFSRKHATDWLAAHAPGTRVQLTAAVDRVLVFPDHERWRVEIVVGPIKSNLFGGTAELQPLVNADGLTVFPIFGDEAFAKRAKAWKPGRKVNIVGTLTKVDFQFLLLTIRGPSQQMDRTVLHDWDIRT